MKKKMIAFILVVLFVVLGALPFAVGGIQNWYMLTYMDSALPFRLIPVLFLLVWGCIAFFLNGKRQTTKKIVICLNLIAAIDLMLLGAQELILHAYWLNVIGRYSQYFYLPMITLGFRLTKQFLHVFPAYAVSFILMVGASFIGCKLREVLKSK